MSYIVVGGVFVEYVKKYRYFILLLICLIPDIYLFIVISNDSTNYVVEDQIVSSVEEVHEVAGKVLVDVKGAVRHPGVYEMYEGDRVINAIDLCGGLLEDANTIGLNLSKKVSDEMIIYVPYKDEDVVIDDGDNKISLNTASLDELMTLSGVGESKAKAIIEYRNNKKFESIEEITNIKGISESLYEQIKDYITI